MSGGIDINNAMASAVNVLGDVHGGAGQQCMELYQAIVDEADRTPGTSCEQAANAVLDRHQATVSKIVPGFGHRFHHRDPRSVCLLQMLDAARQAGAIEGKYLEDRK